MTRMVKIGRRLKKDPELAMALNDEYVQHISLKSFRSAFFVLLIAQAVLLIVNLIYSIPSKTVIQISILIGALSPFISFLILDHEK